jgi:hypothetical protein
VLTELDEQAIDVLIEYVVSLLADDGILISVEAHRNYVMRQRARVAKKAASLGLNIYHPCPPGLTCPKDDCWMWSEDQFRCHDIIVRGNLLKPTRIQKANWMILCKKPCSIYHIFNEKNPQLVWGVAAPGTKSPTCKENKARQSYEFCAETGLVQGVITSGIGRYRSLPQEELFKRGEIVGLTGDCKRITIEWDIVPGFKTCNEEITLEVG